MQNWELELETYTNYIGCDYVNEATVCATPPEEQNYKEFIQMNQTRLAIHVGNLEFGKQRDALFNSMINDYMQYGQENVEFLLEQKYPVGWCAKTKS